MYSLTVLQSKRFSMITVFPNTVMPRLHDEAGWTSARKPVRPVVSPVLENS